MILRASPITTNEPCVMAFGAAEFSKADGPGTRSVVFFQGCHVGCPWCHSPHSIPDSSPLLFNADGCITCGRCVSACPNGVHTIVDNAHLVDRAKCSKCGICINACPQSAINRDWGALCLPTRKVSVSSLFAQLPLSISDGITLSGGEALLQTQAAVSLLRLCKQNGVHTAVETSGLLDQACYAHALPYVDVWLFGVRVLTGMNDHYKTDKLMSVVNCIKDGSNSTIIPRIPMIAGVMDKTETLHQILGILEKIGTTEIWLNPWNRHYTHYYTLAGIKPLFPLLQESEISRCQSKMKTFFLQQGYTIIKGGQIA